MISLFPVSIHIHFQLLYKMQIGFIRENGKESIKNFFLKDVICAVWYELRILDANAALKRRPKGGRF